MSGRGTNSLKLERGSKTQKSQSQVALQVLNLQETLNGIFLSLERIERFENYFRSQPLRSHPDAGMYHMDLDTHKLALETKSVCLRQILNSYDDKNWLNQVQYQLRAWYQTSSKSTLILECCKEVEGLLNGSRSFEVQPLQLDRTELHEAQSALFKNAHRYQNKVSEVERDPTRYLNREEQYKICPNQDTSSSQGGHRHSDNIKAPLTGSSPHHEQSGSSYNKKR
jgi:hypothetical protein